MSTPLGEIQKPEAEQYRKGRKLYLVPLFAAPLDSPADLKQKLERYWVGAGEHIARLESALGPVSRVYHETVFVAGDEGVKPVEQMNPFGFGLVRHHCQVGAQLEATEDRELVVESSDWQRCLYVGLVSQKASTRVFQAYMDTINKRYEYIASHISETLKEDESAILIIGDNHRVQFPGDIQVFYVSPPALNDLRRWMDDQSRQGAKTGEEEGREEEGTEGQETEESKGDE